MKLLFVYVLQGQVVGVDAGVVDEDVYFAELLLCFDVVYSSGVLDDCSRGLQRVRTYSAPGSTLRCTSLWIPIRPCDPVLRDRESEAARREAWVRDQYQHPEEHRHTLAEIQGWFAENGVEYLRAYPSAMLCEDSEELFTSAADNWRVEGWLAQIGWMASFGHEGGLFVTVGKLA